MSDKKYQTIVIEYEGDEPPLPGFGDPVLGCEVVQISMKNELAPKSPQQIIDDALSLARALYSSIGYEVSKGFKFYESSHPQEQSMWEMAALAYEHIECTDVVNVLDELQDEQDA